MVRRKALTEEEKEYIRVRKEGGVSLGDIAKELGCSREVVKKWWRYHRTGQKPRPVGRPKKGPLSSYAAEVRDKAVEIKRKYPHWGPVNVKLELKRALKVSEEELPSTSGLSALFKTACPEAVQVRHRQAYPDRLPLRVTWPHQRWQIDGKERVSIGDRDLATILDVRDPVGALMIAAQAIMTTTAKGWRKVTLCEVQATLRAAFTEWGLPLEIQTDHEVVYTGSPTVDFPSHFTLWLIGLGLTHVTSRNRRPTDQPQVERNHRTLGDMAYKDEHFDSLELLQAALDDRRDRHNTEFPTQAAQCHGQPPLVVYPWASHSGRVYHPALEWDLFNMAHVDDFLAQHVWTRLVNDTGCVAVGNHLYYLSQTLRGQTVSVRFAQETRAFRFQLADGSLIRDCPSVGLNKEDFIGFIPVEALPFNFQLPLPLLGV